MRLRTFSAASMSEAMRLVRDELGPDAVILSTETQGRSVKVTAALDRAAMIEPAPLPMEEPLDTIGAVLDFHHIPSPLSDRLLNIATNFLLENPRQALGAALRARFGYSSILQKRPERPIMLVGLPGAGKTSTLAKLAAGAKMANWPVIAITCDLAKAGGIDQLAIYAKALEITAYQAKNAASLKRAVAAAPEGALVLIDTAGANPLRPEELSDLAELAKAAKAEPVPVFAAGGDVAESAEQGQLFSELGCQRLIATRIDSARRYGGILAAADAGQLALAEFGVSPEIGNGLMFFGADALARLLMPQEMAKPRKTAQNSDRPRFGFDTAPPDPPPSLGKARKRPLEFEIMSDPQTRPSPVAAEARVANAIAIASGKGGVGKTWLSISLTQAMAKAGQRVLLFDGDFGLANIDVQLGIQPGMDLGTALERQIPLSRAVINYPVGGFDLIAGRSGSGNLANMPIGRLQALAAGLKSMSGAYSRIVIDLGAGIERPVRYLAGHAAQCVVVTTDEPTALTDAYALIKMLTLDGNESGHETPVGVVINMATSREIGQRTFETLAKACDRFLKRRIPLLGVIRRDPKVRESISAQTPLLVRYPNSPAAQDVEALARRIIEQNEAGAVADPQAKRST